MLDRLRRRAVAGIALRGPCVARNRARPAFPLPPAVRELLAWRERGQAERWTGQRGFIGFGRGVAAALLVTLAGCAVGPDFVPPLAPVADQWLEWRNKSLQTGPEEYRDWWRVFHDPILDRLIEIAYGQNLTLGVQAAWQLDFWGKFRRGVESADSTYLASIASYDDVLVTLLGDVASTYVGIRTLEKQIAIARENIVKQRVILAIARDRYHGGAATLLDVYQAENVLGATEATVPQLMIQLQKGLDALRVLLGLAPEPLGFLLERSTAQIPVAPRKVVVGVPADLLRRRPDIRTAELRAAAQSAQIGVADADLYPAGTFGGIANNVGGHNLLQVFQPIGRAFSVGPAFQWNLLNYGQITNNVRLQDATLQQYLVPLHKDYDSFVGCVLVLAGSG